MASVLTTASLVRPRHARVQLHHQIVRLDGSGRQKVLNHLKYLSREGKGRDGTSAELYSAIAANTDKHRFSDLTHQHRHQFRVVLEPHKGWEYQDFRGLVGRLMDQVGADVRTDLDWVAADHFDNGKPHSHIVIAGRDRHGDDLLIAPNYLQDGMRERANELVSLDLGPDAGADIEQERYLTAEKAIDLDLELLGRADPKGIVLPHDPDGHHQGLLTRRLITLGSLGLADRQPHGAWQLREDMLVQLARIEQRNREWTSVQNVGAEQHPDRPRSDYAVWDNRRQGTVIGCVLASQDLANGGCSVILDTVMGEMMRAHGRSAEKLLPDMIVRVGRAEGWPDDALSDQGAAFTILSRQPIAQQIESSAHTWLDQIAAQDAPIQLGHGFGKEVRQALVERHVWLRQHGLQRDTTDFSPEI